MGAPPRMAVLPGAGPIKVAALWMINPAGNKVQRSPVTGQPGTVNQSLVNQSPVSQAHQSLVHQSPVNQSLVNQAVTHAESSLREVIKPKRREDTDRLPLQLHLARSLLVLISKTRSWRDRNMLIKREEDVDVAHFLSPIYSIRSWFW